MPLRYLARACCWRQRGRQLQARAVKWHEEFMVTATIGDIRVSMTEGELPARYDRVIDHARLVDSFGLQGAEPGLKP